MQQKFIAASIALAWGATLGVVSGSAWAQKPVKLPDTFPVYAAFAPIDDGTMHVIVLKPGKDSPAPGGSLPKFCKAGWQFGWVQNAEGIKVGNAPSSALGCWTADEQDPKTSTVTFRFYGSKVKKVRQFTLPGTALQKMSFDWRTELLHTSGS